ncbi:MAG: hypothetical protein Q8T09_07260 [Candidatus Melainabacteria bacterium]|nr:hypothetical protein [Candidatus Melainabacteria bacterium]
MTEKKKSLIATALSTSLWLMSIILAFQIPATSPLIWLPDSLLLLGFVPLLLLVKQSWLVLLFGLSNAFIGFFLLVLTHLESDKFVGEVLMMKQHLVTMHSPWAWLVIGLLVTVWGAIASTIDIVKLIRRLFAR